MMNYNYKDNFSLSNYDNEEEEKEEEELVDLLYKEMLGEDLYKMCKIILKQLPKRYKYRIISK